MSENNFVDGYLQDVLSLIVLARESYLTMVKGQTN